MTDNALRLTIPGHLFDLFAKQAKAQSFISTEAYILHVLEEVRKMEEVAGTVPPVLPTADKLKSQNTDPEFNAAEEQAHLHALSWGFSDADDLKAWGAAEEADRLRGSETPATEEENSR